jgi:hypothetical protein
MLAQPSLQRVGAAAGQDVDPLAGLGIDEDGGVAMAPLEGEVVHAEDPWHSGRRQRKSRQYPQRSRAGDRDGQAVGETGTRPAR